MRRRARPLIPLVGGALAALALAGCVDVEHPSPSATALPAGITANLGPLSADAELRQLSLEIHNSSEDPLEIGLVRVEDPRFIGRAGRVVKHPTTIPPGETGSIRLQLPRLDCDVPNLGTPTVSVGFSLGAASSVAITALPDTSEVISSVYASECGDGITAGSSDAAQ
jgi:hypothetical protein